MLITKNFWVPIGAPHRYLISPCPSAPVPSCEQLSQWRSQERLASERRRERMNSIKRLGVRWDPWARLGSVGSLGCHVGHDHENRWWYSWWYSLVLMGV